MRVSIYLMAGERVEHLRWKIDGPIPLILKKASILVFIDGGIPPITSKNVKIGDFALHKRKTSSYIP